MNCLAGMVKYILYIFNLIFVICGILLIVLGSIMISNIGNISDFDDAINADIIPILIIVLGCVIFVIAFFGCCGAIRENICLTTTYAVFMFILFCLQIALVVWIFVQRTQFLNDMDTVITTVWNKNDASNGYPMDAVQISFKCCGLNGSLDYTGNNKDVPSSCCGYMNGQCDVNVYESKPGCRSEFREFWATNTDIIRYAGIGVALVELIAFTFACCLASSIRKSR
ncbi:23 kDa integral membrane protein [Stomoxys calcitrans]|uniref:Tetraspanin n=1 Tax=Stomoxys calcitrans TaxID=35570 RepID=A0A1I8PEJ6_STOCA|nr:23 kDa integral membrane protein [Stomoxys calcitrans]